MLVSTYKLTSFPEFTKNGDLEVLKFPQFRSELLRQSYWSPADEVGRIKIIVSEGFPRDSLTMPIERVKNIIAFSFQHAPLGKTWFRSCNGSPEANAHALQTSLRALVLPGRIPPCGVVALSTQPCPPHLRSKKRAPKPIFIPHADALVSQKTRAAPLGTTRQVQICLR